MVILFAESALNYPPISLMSGSDQCLVGMMELFFCSCLEIKYTS